MMRRFLAYNPGVADLSRVCKLLGQVIAGDPGHGPFHLLVQSAGAIGLSWDPAECVCEAWPSSSLPYCFSLSVLQKCLLSFWTLVAVRVFVGSSFGFEGFSTPIVLFACP